jgi:hypothetical protein
MLLKEYTNERFNRIWHREPNVRLASYIIRYGLEDEVNSSSQKDTPMNQESLSKKAQEKINEPSQQPLPMV